jgi:hypothetical protein
MRWSRVRCPNPSTIWNGLYGVSAVSASDAWVVGTLDDTVDLFDEQVYTIVLHWDGTTWSKVPSPSPSSSSYHTFLNDVSANSPTDAWAVGYYSDLSTGINVTLILHWDGTSWSQA